MENFIDQCSSINKAITLKHWKVVGLTMVICATAYHLMFIGERESGEEPSLHLLTHFLVGINHTISSIFPDLSENSASELSNQNLSLSPRNDTNGSWCGRLLSDGIFYHNDAWQPTGCMLHKYQPKEAEKCMNLQSFWHGKSPHIVFIGDSRVRQMYFSFVKMLSSDQDSAAYKLHHNITFDHDTSKGKVEFIWQPFVNNSMVEYFRFLSECSSDAMPSIIVGGSTTWTIKYIGATVHVLKEYQSNLTKLSHLMRLVSQKTDLIWTMQDPVDEAKLGSNRSMITNNLIKAYNHYTADVMSGTGAHMWKSARQVGKHFLTESPDGLHMSENALFWNTQMLLNRICNQGMGLRDGQCCTAPEPVALVQIVAAVIFVFCIGGWLVTYLLQNRSQGDHHPLPPVGPSVQTPLQNQATADQIVVQVDNSNLKSTSQVKRHEDSAVMEGMQAMARLAVIMTYFFLCDRANIFMKENKHYSHLHFVVLISYVIVIGIVFTATSKQSVILHRDQSDEWKGWMQLIILIYHITGASRVLPVYMMIRVMVTSYLFMSGYGHFCFFWSRGDFSIHRFCAVMFRMNFLVIVLCFVMKRPYQFYYFVPLVSFWYIVLYVVMASWPVVTAAVVKAQQSYYIFLFLKIATLVTGIYVLNSSQVLFEHIFLTPVLKWLFVTSDDDIHEWHFRWQLDRFSTVYGMAFAFLVIMAKKWEVLNDKTSSDWLFSPMISFVATILAVFGLGGYAAFAFTCSSKPPCNLVHSYIGLIPILSFIFLRNLWGYIRVRYSTYFAWVGRISLELFIGQYHIWLAADTQGVLVLIPNLPTLNLIVTTFIFVLIAHEINAITSTMTTLLVPNDSKQLIRNALIFVCVLLPLVIHQGAF